jgi:hypothetical protein
MLNHYFKINDHSNLNSSVMVQFGKIGNSNLDYQNANSPDPTYLKTTSYYSSMYGKDEGEYSGALRRIMKMPKRVLQFLANLKLIGIPCIQPKSGNRFQWKYHGL